MGYEWSIPKIKLSVWDSQTLNYVFTRACGPKIEIYFLHKWTRDYLHYRWPSWDSDISPFREPTSLSRINPYVCRKEKILFWRKWYWFEFDTVGQERNLSSILIPDVVKYFGLEKEKRWYWFQSIFRRSPRNYLDQLRMGGKSKFGINKV